jgi:hypothetical protein
MEADISIWRKTGHFYFALTHPTILWILWRYLDSSRKAIPEYREALLAITGSSGPRRFECSFTQLRTQGVAA